MYFSSGQLCKTQSDRDPEGMLPTPVLPPLPCQALIVGTNYAGQETAGTKVQYGGQTISKLELHDCRVNYLYLTGAAWLGKLFVSDRCSLVGRAVHQILFGY